MKLYTYWRSSAAYRVRIALALKNIDCENIPVSLVKDGGEHRSNWYKTKNPSQLIPTLELNDGTCIAQSLAIIDYLEKIEPQPKLLPNDPIMRSRVLEIAYDIAMDTHPLNNMRVAVYLKSEYGLHQEKVTAWMDHWMKEAFYSIERKLPEQAVFAYSDTPNLADICIVPQIYNAKRWNLDMTPYPKMRRIDRAAEQHHAFFKAIPENQSDATSQY